MRYVHSFRDILEGIANPINSDLKNVQAILYII